MLALSVPACSFPDPQLSDRDSMSHQQPPNLNFPGVLNLVHTFSQASLGLQQDALKLWIVDSQLDNSTAELRDFVVNFQKAVLNDIDRLNQTFKLNEPFPYFLSETTKFTVLPAKSFQQNLYDCALLHGYLPYGMHLLHNVIDQQQVPPKIQISQKPIFRSGDARQWRNTINTNSELCSIWQINPVTKQAEIIAAQPNCNQDLPSICLQATGIQTYSNLSDHQANRHQLLASSQHLYYLLTQLETYPSPSKRFASDILLHIIEAFEIFANFIENETNVPYQALFASKRCIGLVQLALQKAQHSESWKAEERQQANFEKIQELLNSHTSLIQNMESRFQGLVLQQRQFEPLSKGGLIDDPSPLEGSGCADEDEDDDANASSHQSNVSTHPDHVNANDNDSNSYDNVSNHDDNPQANVSLKQDNDHVNANDSNSYDNVSNHDDNPHANVSSKQDNAHVNANDVNDNNGQSADDDDDSWYFSNLFSWDSWGYQTQNLTETTLSQNSEDQFEMFDFSSNESYPSDIYSKFEMVKFWPFSNLLTLAAFHLFNIIEFYINLLLKILALLLAAYVFILDRKVQRLEQKCDRLNQVVININRSEPPSCVPDRMKQLALRQHRIQQSSPSDPQCAQPLLATSQL